MVVIAEVACKKYTCRYVCVLSPWNRAYILGDQTSTLLFSYASPAVINPPIRSSFWTIKKGETVLFLSPSNPHDGSTNVKTWSTPGNYFWWRMLFREFLLVESNGNRGLAPTWFSSPSVVLPHAYRLTEVSWKINEEILARGENSGAGHSTRWKY